MVLQHHRGFIGEVLQLIAHLGDMVHTNLR